jgi:hypothetical protein
MTMKRFMKTLAPVVSLAVFGMAPLALAGSTSETAYCYQNADGSGHCYGNFLGWRNSSQTSAYAYFSENDSGSRSFYARYTVSGATTPSSYSCIPDASVAAVWGEALGHKGYFSISWNTSGTCYSLSLYNGSQYANY